MSSNPWDLVDEGEDLSEFTLTFEAIKTAMRQTKEGYNLTLVLHPDDVPMELYKDYVGSRYRVVMVRLDDDDAPYVRTDKSDTQSKLKKLVASAAMLCQEHSFQLWLVGKGYTQDATEDAAVVAMRRIIGAESRAEIATDENVRRKFINLRNAFQQDNNYSGI